MENRGKRTGTHKLRLLVESGCKSALHLSGQTLSVKMSDRALLAVDREKITEGGKQIKACSIKGEETRPMTAGP